MYLHRVTDRFIVYSIHEAIKAVVVKPSLSLTLLAQPALFRVPSRVSSAGDQIPSVLNSPRHAMEGVYTLNYKYCTLMQEV